MEEETKFPGSFHASSHSEKKRQEPQAPARHGLRSLTLPGRDGTLRLGSRDSSMVASGVIFVGVLVIRAHDDNAMANDWTLAADEMTQDGTVESEVCNSIPGDGKYVAMKREGEKPSSAGITEC